VNYYERWFTKQMITNHEIQKFVNEGVVAVRQVLNTQEVESLQTAVASIEDNPGPLSIRLSDKEDPKGFIEDFRRWEDQQFIEEIARHSALPHIASLLTKSSTIRFHHDHVLVRSQGNQQRTPWHQDQPYYDLNGSQTVSFWLPLDPVPVEESIEVIASTHTGSWMMPRTFVDKEARWFPEGTLQEIPDIDKNRDSFPIRSWSLEPGDAICFSFLSLHAAPGSAKGRRTVSLRYIGDDVRRAQRSWRTSPPFPELEDSITGLQDGAELNHPLFPMVWP